MHAGYNWQTGPWVLSVEGDVDFAGHINSTKSLLICVLVWKASSTISVRTTLIPVIAICAEGGRRFRRGASSRELSLQ